MDVRIALRKTLEDELSTLLRRHAKIEAHLTNADRDVPADSGDRAILFENDEVLEALDDRTRWRIEELRRTIGRMDEPHWGDCGQCGRPIPPQRLEILPTATLCVPCAEKAA